MDSVTPEVPQVSRPRNEAAERLRAAVLPEAYLPNENDGAVYELVRPILEAIDAALAEECSHVIAQIREGLATRDKELGTQYGDLPYRARILQVLDAVEVDQP